MWAVNPFEKIASVWREVVEGSKVAKPHVAGRIELSGRRIVELELVPVLFEGEKRVSMRADGEILFVIPVRPEDGPEGLYIKIVKLLGMGA